MAALNGCPRCLGAVLNDSLDEFLCVNCGWRPVYISPEIQSEVEAYWGRRIVGDARVANRIGTGKPAASGWDKEKRRRERNGGLE